MERLSVSAGGAAEGSAGSPAGQPRWGARQGQAPERAAPGFLLIDERALKRATEDGVRQDLVTSRNLRAPSEREACAANFQGLRAQALAPAWHPSGAAPLRPSQKCRRTFNI